MSFKTKIDKELYSMHKTNADETDSRAANVINLLTTRSSSISVLKKRIVYSSEFFLSSCSCGKHTSTERMRIPKIPMKEVGTDFFGCYSVCETMKDTKEGYFIV